MIDQWKSQTFIQFAVPGSIEISGDDATVCCLCYEAGRGPGQYYRNTGIDTVRLHRSDTGWVFTSRSYQYLWLDYSPFSGDVFRVGTRESDARRTVTTKRPDGSAGDGENTH